MIQEIDTPYMLELKRRTELDLGLMVASERALPEAMKRDMDAYAACLAGALLKEDYLAAILEQHGIKQVRSL